MIEWAISSTALTALFLGLRRLVRGRISPRLQYALWAVVLLRLLIPVSLGTSELSLGHLTRRAAETEAIRAVSQLAREELPARSYETVYEEVQQEYAQQGIDISRLSPAEYQQVEREIQTRRGGGLSLRDIWMAVWAAGAAAVFLVLAAANIRFARKLKGNRTRLEGTESTLPVYVSPEAETPCLVGLLHPTIYVTPETAENETMLRHCIRHELTHAGHGDPLWSLLRGVCLGLHWYNPLVWWAAFLARDDADLACDEATIRRLGEGERAEYGRTLIALTCGRRFSPLLTATTMAGGRKTIRQRILMIAKRPKNGAWMLMLVLALAGLAVGCTFTGAGENNSNRETPVEQSVTAPTESPSREENTEPTGQRPGEPEKPLDPAEAMERILETGDVSMTLNLSEGEVCVLSAVDDWCGDNLRGLLDWYRWSPAEPIAQETAFWVEISAGDGSSMTFSAPDMLVCRFEEAMTWWRLRPTGNDTPAAEAFRHVFYNLETDARRMVLRTEGDTMDTVRFFAECYGDFLCSLSPGNQCRLLDYEVGKGQCTVVATGQDDKAVVGTFTYAFTPEYFNSPDIWAGNTREGAGEYQGKLLATVEFVLQKQEDGLWRCTSLGTGGCRLPEDGAEIRIPRGCVLNSIMYSSASGDPAEGQ